MSTWSLTSQKSLVSDNTMTNISKSLPTRWRRKPAGINMKRNYVTVTLCITSHDRALYSCAIRCREIMKVYYGLHLRKTHYSTLRNHRAFQNYWIFPSRFSRKRNYMYVSEKKQYIASLSIVIHHLRANVSQDNCSISRILVHHFYSFHSLALFLVYNFSQL